MISGNIFEKIIIDKEKEIFETIYKNENVKIERIISYGQTSKPNFWYEQKESEFVMILQGGAVLEYDNGNKQLLKNGDYTIIPSYCKHRVTFTSKDTITIWLAVFF